MMKYYYALRRTNNKPFNIFFSNITKSAINKNKKYEIMQIMYILNQYNHSKLLFRYHKFVIITQL